MQTAMLRLCLAILVICGTSHAGGGGSGIGDSCEEDVECANDHSICVGTPCDSVCECEPGYKICKRQDECIPDLSDTVLAGGNCTLDSECKGAGFYCKRLIGQFNNNGDPEGTCVAGQLTLKQTGNTGLGGGTEAVRSTHALNVFCAFCAILLFTGLEEDIH